MQLFLVSTNLLRKAEVSASLSAIALLIKYLLSLFSTADLQYDSSCSQIQTDNYGCLTCNSKYLYTVKAKPIGVHACALVYAHTNGCRCVYIHNVFQVFVDFTSILLPFQNRRLSTQESEFARYLVSKCLQLFPKKKKK